MLGGQTTASTFVLDQPRCIFNNYGNADIWLVVALDGGRWEQPSPGQGACRGSLYPPPSPSSPPSPPCSHIQLQQHREAGDSRDRFPGLP